MVDLDHSLKADDVKKDNFGVWNHNESHDLKFECRFGPNGDIEIGKGVLTSGIGWETFLFRRLHSNHPTNNKFCQMLTFITDEWLVLLATNTIMYLCKMQYTIVL